MERTSPTKPMTQRCPLHIRACAHPAIPAETVQQIDALEAEIRTAAPRIDDVRAFGPGVVQGCGAGTGVWFGDTAEIPLLGLNRHKRFDYRLGWLASEGDIVVIGGPSCPAFEAYQRGRLAAPGLTYLNIDPHIRTPRASTLALCLRDPEAYGRLVAALAGASGVTLHAHLTTGRAWALAALLYQDLGVNVHVSGPPPNLSQLTNNKLWFGKVVQRLLGTGAIPEKRAAHSASALTRHVADLARKRAQLVIKLPDSAGSEGNFIVVAREIRGLTLLALRDRLITDLSSAGCQRRFPFLVEVWDANVLANPSVQTWIPLPTEGPPVIEGIFEQILSDDRAAFAGAVQIDPPQLVRDLLLQGAFRLALLFQRLGYFGRCSFDTVVTGESGAADGVHWIECNARWGGVSVPMSLVNRLSKRRSLPAYIIVQNEFGPLPPLPFARARCDFADVEAASDLTSGILFLTPNLLEAGAGCHFLSFGHDVGTARSQAESILHRMRNSANIEGLRRS